MTDDNAEKSAEKSGKMTVEKVLALMVAAVVVGAFTVLLIQAIILR
ncbi:MAG: hypothetical protein IT483_06795 [Gammaproteobacteria bacterium]|nr:hypothetical protein [Gammaproteobacteria bacterium]